MIETTSALISAVRGAISLAKSSLDARIVKQVEDSTIALTDHITSLQESYLRQIETQAAILQEKYMLENKKRELETKIMRLEHHLSNMAQYELTHTPAGSTVLTLKQSVQNSQHATYICATCAQSQVVTFLQPDRDWDNLVCPVHGVIPFAALSYTRSVRSHNPYENL